MAKPRDGKTRPAASICSMVAAGAATLPNPERRKSRLISTRPARAKMSAAFRTFGDPAPIAVAWLAIGVSFECEGSGRVGLEIDPRPIGEARRFAPSDPVGEGNGVRHV